MTDKELMQQALDALEGYARNCRCEGGGAPCDAAEALRARLAPPQREWVGLTREELAEIAEFHFHGALSGREFYDDVETKLKEKNT